MFELVRISGIEHRGSKQGIPMSIQSIEPAVIYERLKFWSLPEVGMCTSRESSPPGFVPIGMGWSGSNCSACSVPNKLAPLLWFSPWRIELFGGSEQGFAGLQLLSIFNKYRRRSLEKRFWMCLSIIPGSHCRTCLLKGIRKEKSLHPALQWKWIDNG